jgi:GNAT superfamily N-acetyltransferase
MPVIDSVTPRLFDESCVFQSIEPVRFALVDRFYRSQGYKVKSGMNERVYTIENESDGFIAAVRLVPQSSGHYWLRNLLVATEWRGQGVATRLMCKLLPDLSSQGCYCFALPHLADFYAGLGFTQNPSHCPEDILRTYNTYRARGRDWVLMGYIQG